MTLVNRLSLFFLASLTAALVGVSALFYTLFRAHLEQQFDQQLYGALHLLVAAVEVEPDDVKFEPSDHTIGLGTEDGLEDVRWLVCDEAGLVMDHSRNLSTAVPGDLGLFAYGKTLQTLEDAAADLEGCACCSVGWPRRARSRPPNAIRWSEKLLVVTVGRSPADLRANLRLLGWLSFGVPAVVGLLASLVVRRLCRRALEPLRTMAVQAREMSGTQADKRLPTPDSRDELSELGTAFNGASWIDCSRRWRSSDVSPATPLTNSARRWRDSWETLKWRCGANVRRATTVRRYPPFTNRPASCNGSLKACCSSRGPRRMPSRRIVKRCRLPFGCAN
ncbi:MAG: HAMP domain-containing protein [Pirellulales bacterium]